MNDYGQVNCERSTDISPSLTNHQVNTADALNRIRIDTSRVLERLQGPAIQEASIKVSQGQCSLLEQMDMNYRMIQEIESMCSRILGLIGG